MAGEVFGNVEEVRDADGAIASPASDEQVRELVGQGSNWAGLASETVSDDTTGSTPTSNVVPDGVSVAVQAQNGNTDLIKVGPPGGEVYELKGGQGIAVQVDDTADIGILAVSTGDGVNLLWESDA